MPLHFHRAVEKIEIWSAYSDGYSFVISHENLAGPGFHGRPGFLASWRPAYAGLGAIKIIGSPFKTFDEAEAACDAMLINLMGTTIDGWSLRDRNGRGLFSGESAPGNRKAHGQYN
jgi:hypothetical protein